MRELLDLYTQRFSSDWPPPNAITYMSLLLGCWIYALARGGAPEKTGVTILAIGSLIVWFMPPAAKTVQSAEFGMFVVDLACLAAFLVLALAADRFWTLWAAAFQVVATAAHVARLVDPDILGRTYAFMVAIWAYPMIFAMIVGTWRHQKRLARFGLDRSWSSQAAVA